MMKLTLGPTALAAVVLAAPGPRPAEAPSGDSPATVLHDTMRKLWIDHVAWTPAGS